MDAPRLGAWEKTMPYKAGGNSDQRASSLEDIYSFGHKCYLMSCSTNAHFCDFLLSKWRIFGQPRRNVSLDCDHSVNDNSVTVV